MQFNANWMHGRDDDLDKKKARRLSMTTANLERCPWQDRRKFKKNTAETFCSVNNRVPWNWNGREDDLIKKKH